jgi:hypothetical protein
LSRIVAFIAQTPGSATIEDQQACLEPSDLQVLAGRRTFGQLEDLLALKGIRLGKGDRVKVHDLPCLDIATPMLVRAVVKLLKQGVTFEVCTPKIVIEPSGDDKVHAMLEALDSHYRHMHGIKTHPREMAPAGRKRLLDPSKLPEIQAKLNEPGATQAEVAQSLGVSRSTLFNYLEKYDVERQAERPRRKGSTEAFEPSRDAADSTRKTAVKAG